jgi:nitrile hydratase accessory protein
MSDQCHVFDTDGLRAEVRQLLGDQGDRGFTCPGELRAFAVAVAAHREGHYPWAEFQRALIDTIGAWERDPKGDWSYYEHWLDALEQVVVASGFVTALEVTDRTAEILAAPAKSDHPTPA